MKQDENLIVFDLGGSIVVPDKPDTDFLRDFLSFFTDWLNQDSSRRAIIVVGGGAPARIWQNAVRELVPQASHDSLDWVGVMATRLNAEFMRAILGSLCPDSVVNNPTGDFSFTGRVLMAAGWKPGFSTDYDAVLLAERFGAQRVLMLSNIAQIYDSDPRNNPEAKAFSHLTWDEYMLLINKKWVPGISVPFDPVAAEHAAKIGLSVVAADGRNLENLNAILHGNKFIGTEISSTSH